MSTCSTNLATACSEKPPAFPRVTWWLLLLLVLAILAISFVLPQRHPVIAPTGLCAGTPAVLLFSAMDTRCLVPQGTGRDQQVLARPLSGVVRVCAQGVTATVGYASSDDPAAVIPDASGWISLALQAGRCETVQHTVDLATMTVTEVAFNAPSEGGSLGLSTMQAHQVTTTACTTPPATLAVWTTSGQEHCFTGRGQLTVAPLAVVRVCAGTRRGEVSFLQGLFDTVVLDLASHHCATPATVLQEASLTITQVSLFP